MHFKKILAMLAMSVAMAGGAKAHVVTTTDGLSTTYAENFDGGTSFIGGIHVNSLFSSDDYLLVNSLAPTAFFTFSSAQALAELTLSFWYSVSADFSGYVALTNVGAAVLPNTPQYFFDNFLGNNPGAGGSVADALFSATVFDLNPGSYTLSFFSLAGLKIDDLTITSVAQSAQLPDPELDPEPAPEPAPVSVPEPASLALLGLGLLGFAATRRKAAGRA